jgi:serine-type D-Ala-D-Ala carboxypeptidase (penicillin-binding protein 5/6)
MRPSLLNSRVLARRAVLLGGIFLPVAAIAQTAPKPKRPPAKPPVAGKPAVPKKAENAIPTGTPARTPLGPLDTEAKYAVVIDFTSGATLLDKDADVSQVPSSLTKMMTAYLVYERLKKGQISLSQEFPVSEKAWRMQGSKMFVGINTSVKVEDLIRGMIVQSGNDACIVLAEGIAGTEQQFVELMNAKAREFGLTGTNFRNCTGWPDPEHRMTVRDIATVARRLIADFPEYYHFDSEKSFKYNGIDQANRNTLVLKGVADGLKTGHTDEGGYGLAVSAQRGNRRVIVVVNGLPSMHARGEEGERLLDWAFASFENVQLFAAGDVIEKAPVWLGAQASVPLVGGRDLVLTMPRNWRDKMKVSVDYDSPVPAPITRGTRLGTLTVAGDGVPNIEMPLLAGADVQRLGLAGRSMAVLNRMLHGG